MTLFTPTASTSAGAGRRKFLQQAAVAGAGVAAIAAGAGRHLAAQAPTAVTDADILNFALNLEYLEAEFYTMATTGQHIDASGVGIAGTGTQGDTTGGNLVQFKDHAHFTIAQEIAQDERAHVTLLRTVLGSAAVAKPAINLDALGLGFGSQTEFLTLARAFEDTGVSAYAGASPYIQNKTYLLAAARILATEAYHASNIRYSVIYENIDGGVVGPLDDVDIVPVDWRYFTATYQGLAIIRSPRQVLDIVFHSKGATSGGFFPNGVNSSNLAGLAAIPAPDEYIP